MAYAHPWDEGPHATAYSHHCSQPGPCPTCPCASANKPQLLWEPLVQRHKTDCGKGCQGLSGSYWKWLGYEKLPSGWCFALICLLPCQIIGDDTDSPEDSASGFRYQIALGFFKNPILGWSHWHKLQSILTDFYVSTQTKHTTTHPTQPSHRGRAKVCAGSIHANRVVSSALTSFLFLPFPHMGMWGILTPANLSGSVKHQSFMVFIELWDPYLGSAAEMQSIPYGWPYHWEKNLKSDPFVWLPESHCCIIHDSLLFFRRLILLPSPIRPQTAFIILILYSELNHTVLCSGQ